MLKDEKGTKKTVLKEKGHHKFQQVESKEVVWNVSIDRITSQTKPKLTVWIRRMLHSFLQYINNDAFPL